MKRKKVTQRDPFGREQSTFEQEEDDGSGPFDSRTGLLKDGRSVRVSMMMRDAVPPPSPGAIVMYDVPPQRDALVINTSTPPMIVDAFGGTDGLNRPGARYLVAGHRTVDHAVQATLLVMRDQAYADAEIEASNAWMADDREIEVKRVTGDARADALLAYDDYMNNAWRRGK